MLNPKFPLWTRRLISLLCVIACSACSTSYVTPGGPSDLATLGTTNLPGAMARKPVTRFPAIMSVVRVQAAGFAGIPHPRRFEIVAETEDHLGTPADLRAIEAWPEMGTVTRMQDDGRDAKAKGAKRVEPATTPNSINALRGLVPAGNDLLFVYTVATTFDVRKDDAGPLPPQAQLEFGPFSRKDIEVASSASAIISDAKTGFVYGFTRFTARTETSTRSWKSPDDIESLRRRLEREAFEGVLRASERKWERAILYYAGGRRVG